MTELEIAAKKTKENLILHVLKVAWITKRWQQC